MKATLLFALSALLLCMTACTTTQESRRNAADLAKSVQAFRTKKQHYIDQLNKDYQRTYARLIDDLTKLSDRATIQQFNRDAQDITDDLLDKWEQGRLPQNFRTMFVVGLEAQRRRLANVDASLAAARKKYADSYRDVSLQLKLLQSIESNLQKLSAKPQDDKQTVALLTKLYELYKKSQDQNSTATP